jgi:hypothetical protein
MGKIIVIDESRAEKLFGNIFESAFYPKAEQVIEVQDFLNKNFRKKTLPTINPTNGYADLETYFIYVKNGFELQQMDRDDLIRLLMHEFRKRIKDEDDRKRFLNQVVDDWIANKIKNGILSVNKV